MATPTRVTRIEGGDEATVDLHPGDRQILEPREVRVARAEVVERQRDAQRPQVLHDALGRGDVEQRFLEDLEAQPFGCEVVLRQDVDDEVGERRIGELTWLQRRPTGERVGDAPAFRPSSGPTRRPPAPSTQAPIGTIRPHSSATCRNCSGSTMPWPGRFHRRSASAPTTVSVLSGRRRLGTTGTDPPSARATGRYRASTSNRSMTCARISSSKSSEWPRPSTPVVDRRIGVAQQRLGGLLVLSGAVTAIPRLALSVCSKPSISMGSLKLSRMWSANKRPSAVFLTSAQMINELVTAEARTLLVLWYERRLPVDSGGPGRPPGGRTGRSPP